MSQLSKELILEFQQIIYEEYGNKISYEEASKIGHALVRYYSTLQEAYLAMHKNKKRIDIS